jgi:hypothetical protein
VSPNLKITNKDGVQGQVGFPLVFALAVSHFWGALQSGPQVSLPPEAVHKDTLEFSLISLDAGMTLGVYLAHHEVRNSDPDERGG